MGDLGGGDRLRVRAGWRGRGRVRRLHPAGSVGLHGTSCRHARRPLLAQAGAADGVRPPGAGDGRRRNRPGHRRACSDRVRTRDADGNRHHHDATGAVGTAAGCRHDPGSAHGRERGIGHDRGRGHAPRAGARGSPHRRRRAGPRVRGLVGGPVPGNALGPAARPPRHPRRARGRSRSRRTAGPHALARVHRDRLGSTASRHRGGVRRRVPADGRPRHLLRRARTRRLRAG